MNTNNEFVAQVHARYRLTRWLCLLGRHKHKWWHYLGQKCVRCGKDK